MGVQGVNPSVLQSSPDSRVHSVHPACQASFDDLEQLLASSTPRTAVVDCDGTLWSGDSGYGFMIWSMEQGLISRSASDWIDTRHRAYQSGQVSEARICGEMTQVYAGISERELSQAAQVYFDLHVCGNIFPEMQRVVALLRTLGTDLWAVSSTNKWVIAPGARAFSIPEHRVLAAEVSVASGILTDHLLDVPTDEAKVAALHRVGVDAPDLVFGNSIHDLAMLRIARHSFPVNPSTALLAAGRELGWRYLMPAMAQPSPAAVLG